MESPETGIKAGTKCPPRSGERPSGQTGELRFGSLDLQTLEEKMC